MLTPCIRVEDVPRGYSRTFGQRTKDVGMFFFFFLHGPSLLVYNSALRSALGLFMQC